MDAVFKTLKKQLPERILQAELTAHLGYPPGAPPVAANARNGTTPKTVRTEEGLLTLDIPRDRESSFTPQLVPNGVRRLPGFDQKVLSLCARGVSVREIQGHLEHLYQVEVSPSVISELELAPVS